MSDNEVCSDQASESSETHAEPPLSNEEIAYFRMMARREFGNHPKLASTKFRVPRDHPVFSGSSNELEPFVMEMELLHDKETKNGDEDNPSFITKLVPYFKAKSAVHSWFKMWASSKKKKGQCLSWNGLVTSLREKYGAYEQPRKRFEEFFDLSQTSDIQSYIAAKAEAALLSPEVNPTLELYGFLRGLREDYLNYVNLQCPQTLEAAQQSAIAYENSGSANTTTPKKIRKVTLETKPTAKPSTPITPTSDRKRKSTSNLSRDGEQALMELREIRKRGLCFKCGQSKHKLNECQADDGVIQRYQTKINDLKTRINS
jgi:hypothetical protein